MQLRIGITAVTLELSRLRYLATKSSFFPLLLLLFFFPLVPLLNEARSTSTDLFIVSLLYVRW